MFFYPIIYQDQGQGHYVRAGFKMKDSIQQLKDVIQPHSDIQYHILFTFGGLLLALVACFYIYSKFFGRKQDDTITRERKDSGEGNYDLRSLEKRVESSEKRFDAEINELWRAVSKQNDQLTKQNDRLIDIHSITGEVKGMLSSRRLERD